MLAPSTRINPASARWAIFGAIMLLVFTIISLGVFYEAASIQAASSSEIFWIALTAISTSLSVVVLAATAFYAHNLIVTTKDAARITLTNDVLNSQWLTKAMSDFNEVALKIGFQNVARALKSDDYTDFEKEHSVPLQAALAAIIYVARLYEYGALDKPLVRSTTYLSLGLVFFALHPLTLRSLNSGVYEQSDMTLVREYKTLMFNTNDAGLRGWVRDWNP